MAGLPASLPKAKSGRWAAATSSMAIPPVSRCSRSRTPEQLLLTRDERHLDLRSGVVGAALTRSLLPHEPDPALRQTRCAGGQAGGLRRLGDADPLLRRGGRASGPPHPPRPL